jgi:hypothetical protein
MNRLTFIFLLFSVNYFSQTLPYKDKGFALSYNYSQRHIPLYSYAQKPVHAPGIDFKIHRNFKNQISLKYGVSLFTTGHSSEVYVSSNYNVSSTKLEKATTIYGYLRFPISLSYNVKRFYLDLTTAPCIRIFQSRTIYGRGPNSNSRITYTLESHLGYYIPIKKRRTFIEAAIYFSEIGNRISVTDGRYDFDFKNTYTQNLQLTIGFMLNKTQD